MGETIQLRAADGQTIDAYRAAPAGAPKGGVVVIQEIFGVNSHIRDVADRFARAGYLAVAPALFDRVERGVEIGYVGADLARGTALVQKANRDDALLDIQAAIELAKSGGGVGVVGFCWGGTLAYLSACRLSGLSAAVGYYGGGIAAVAAERPKVPAMMHFGEKDDHIPLADVEKLKDAQPGLPVYVYPAGHGFNCDRRGSYDKPSADEAMKRTLAFFGEHLV